MKRRLVVWVTFLAGLYYVLEFFVPPHIGGAANSAGACAASVWGSLVTYTALREGAPPRLMARPLGAPASLAGSAIVAPSFGRNDDYWGAQNGQIAGPDRLYYVGLGCDDKTPRVCLARRAGQRWQPDARPILDKGPPGSWDASGITWVSVLPPDEGRREWRMWYVGRRGDVGAVGLAVSRDGLRWTKRGGPVLAAGGASIEAVSVLPSQGGLRAWWVRKEAASPGGTVYTQALDVRTGSPQGAASPLHIAPPVGPVRDARLGLEGSRATLYLTVVGADGRPAVVAADGPRGELTAPEAAFRLRSAPIVAPGRRPTSTYLSEARSTVDDLLVVVSAFAVGLGLVSLAQVHGRRLIRRQRTWPESLAFFAAAVAMTAFTLYWSSHKGLDNAGTRGYRLLFYGTFQPLGSAMFSLLAAYLVSAAYRAFRVRTFEAGLMAAAALLVMLGQVPIGNLLTRSLPHPVQIPTLMAWVLFVTNNAVVRAVNFGLFVGALATALRVWLSMDRALTQSME